MRILLVTTSYPVSKNGSEAAGSFVNDFVETLKEQEHDVAVVAPITNGTSITHQNGVSHFWFEVPKLPLSLLTPTKFRNWLPIIKTMSQGKKAVDKAINAFKPDHIFALWALPSGYWAQYAKKHYGIPYSTWALGSDIWSLGQIPLVRNYLKTILQGADHCFADGYQLADDVTKISGKPCEFLPSTRQLPVCGLPLTQTKPPYRLCFLGRWHPNKGIDLLLEALQLLDKEDWKNIEEVRIAGGGPMESLVKEQVTQLQQKGCPVNLLGYQDKFGAAELLVWTDFVIIPSRIESIPVVFSDAMQAMRPVIAMPVGDLPRLLGNRTGGVLVEKITALKLVSILQTMEYIDLSQFSKRLKVLKEQFDIGESALNFVEKIS